MKDFSQTYGRVLRHPPRYRSPIPSYCRQWWGVPTAAAAFLLLLLLRPYPTIIERFFSQGWYLFAANTLGWLTSLFPFSFLEFFGVLGILSAIFFLVKSLHRWRSRRDARLLVKTLRWIVNTVGVLFALYICTCAPNYSRLSFSHYSGLEIQESTTEELYQLCAELTLQANALRDLLPENEAGVYQLDRGIFTLTKQSKTVFDALAQQYAVLPKLPMRPKPVTLSYAMSMAQITGFFSPVTMEANINVLAPDFTLAATACHELAHTRGFMREDEANFLAYLACKDSQDVYFQYSGIMLGLVHANNRLFAADGDLYLQANQPMSQAVRRDFAQNNQYWAAFEGPVAAVSTAVNDTYLKANKQSDGVQSYGRMVDLLLAERRTRLAQEKGG